jgi:hypothetical protein
MGFKKVHHNELENMKKAGKNER